MVGGQVGGRKDIMEFIILIAIAVVIMVVGVQYWKWLVGLLVALIVLRMIGVHPIIMLGLIAIVGVFLYQNSDDYQAKKRSRLFQEWLGQDSSRNYTYAKINERMDGLGRSLSFSEDNIPFGRAEYFAASFNNLFTNGDKVYGYYPVRSQIDSELREYGVIVTNRGIGWAVQTLSDEKEPKSIVTNLEVPFSGLWGVSYDEDNQVITFKLKSKDVSLVLADYSSLNPGLMVANTDFLINSGFTRDLYTGDLDNQVKSKFDKHFSILEAETQTQKLSDDQKQQLFDSSSQKTQTNLNAAEDVDALSRGMNAQAAVTSANNLHNIQINQMVDGRQGHGVAAEYANSVMDGGFLSNSGLRGQDNAKHGADRLSFGRKVQVKTSIKLDSNGQYAGKNTADSIKLAFKDGKTQKMGKYMYGDMPTEVPKDQYNASVKYMRKKILEGKVDGHTDPNDADFMVKQGKYNGDQYLMINRAGNLLSLKVDAINAVEQSLPTVGITFIMAYASARWQGADRDDAAMMAGRSSLSAGVMTAGIMLLTTQAAKTDIAKKMVTSSLAKGIGLKEGAKDIGEYVGNTVTVVITFGPLVVDALRGRISPKQLAKSSVVGGVSLAVGMALKKSVGPFSIVAGALAGYFTKKVMDVFVEDDAKEMFQVYKEEFLDVVMATGFTHEEFIEILELTFQSKKMSSWLKDMFASNDPRGFARNILVEGAVVEVLKERETITNEEVLSAYEIAQERLFSA